jgi:hypothetical protein
MPKKKIQLDEEAVIYFSEEDQCWIAHGLHTDQIGTGQRIVDALADFIKAVDQILDEAAKDESLAYLREAPREIRKIYKTAQALPGEIYEVAHKMVHGRWPSDWNPPEPRLHLDHKRAFKAVVTEPAI